MLIGIIGCAGNTDEASTNDSSENNSDLVSTAEDTTETEESTSTSGGEESTTTTDDENDTSSEGSIVGDEETLSQYSSEQIEYARIWLQLGPNQEIDELNVRHIHAGEPINDNDDSSASYPEDVIQLAGSRLVDGSVTYSGNGDGTINVYDVPLRWDGEYPAEKNFYKDIIGNTELVHVDPNSGEEIIELIKLLNVH